MFRTSLLVVLLLLLTVLSAAPSQAEMCALDNVPAATLLLPYFEVDFDTPDCVTTLFTVNNASDAPTLAHVTLWTDWSQPTLDFDLFLTGYDVVTVNMRQIFDGTLPVTADLLTDPQDTISPHGQNPIWDGAFPSCADFFPFTNPVLPAANLDRLINGHRGRPVAAGGGLCMGANYGDDDTLVRGYVTIDDVVRCSLEFASDPGYFGGADPVASYDNQLWGDFFIVDPVSRFAMGQPLVHIEADEGFNSGSTDSGATFYGRYTAPSGLDGREPLGSAWGVRYLNGGGFDGGTDLLVWRDSTTSDTAEFYTCGQGPSWVPLNETEVIAFDEQEDAVELCSPLAGGVVSPPVPGNDPTCFPYETQRVSVGEGDLAPPFDFGWMFLNLNINDVGVIGDVDFGTNGDIAQSWVGVAHSAQGRFQVGLSAVQLSSACEDFSQSILSTGFIPVAP